MAKIQKKCYCGVDYRTKNSELCVKQHFLRGCYMEDSIVWVKWRQVLCYCVGLGCCVLDVRALDLVFELGESECGMPGGHGK